MRIIVDLILADIIPDIGRAVRLVKESQIFLILSIQIGNTEQRCALACDGSHGPAALRDLPHLLCRPVKTGPRLNQTRKADPQTDCHDDDHHDEKAQVVNNIGETGINREPCDQAADRGRQQTDNNVGDSSHDRQPLIQSLIQSLMQSYASSAADVSLRLRLKAAGRQVSGDRCRSISFARR